MAENIPSYLKLHVERQEHDRQPVAVEFPGLPALCGSFEHATGWALRYTTDGETSDASPPWSVPIESGPSGPPARLEIQSPLPSHDADKPSGRQHRISLKKAQSLGKALAELFSELQRTRCALWQREAELAAGVPLIPHADEQGHLAARLEAVIKGGAESVGCHAAALYLLDEATSQLKLRASWGLPRLRLLEPARPLRGAVADLEALVGHAVVLEDTSILPNWKSPEEFASAVCVPVSTPTAPLGTLWMFCDHVRDFTAQQTNLIEIVAGRLAADLERAMLLQESIESKRTQRQLNVASNWQHERLPQIAPLLDDWQLAGWTAQADLLGGDFYDWCVLPNGNLAIAAAEAHGAMIEAVLGASSLYAALKAHSCYPHDAREMLIRLNETIWTASTGDQFASLFYSLIEPDSGKLTFATAGGTQALVHRGSSCKTISNNAEPLGSQPESQYKQYSKTLRRGEVLLLAGEGVHRSLKEQGRTLEELAVSSLRRAADGSAEQLLKRLRRSLTEWTSGDQRHGHTLVVVRRR